MVLWLRVEGCYGADLERMDLLTGFGILWVLTWRICEC